MIDVPRDHVIRLHIRGIKSIVTVDGPGEPTRPEDLMLRASAVTAGLTHDTDVSWPGKQVESLATAVVRQPQGAVLMIFETVADGMACHRRLMREAGR